MSHVDDGILHAYLDGALDAVSDAGELPDGTTAADVVSHLSVCADCRARLETERAVREGATLVMADLPEPGSLTRELPALTTSPSGRKRWISLGWAASVVLAVGAGWIGSEVWRGDMASLPLERSEAQSSPESAATESAGADDRASADVMASSRAGQASDAVESADAASSTHAPSLPDVASSPDLDGSPDAAISSSAMREPSPLAFRASTPAGDAPPPANAITGASANASANAPAGRPAVAAETQAAAPPPAPAQPVIAGTDRVTGRSEVPLGRSLVSDDQLTGMTSVTDTRLGLHDAQTVLGARMKAMVAFESIIARELSGLVHFVEASPADLISLADQIFVIANASMPSIEAAHEPGHTLVRVRQTTASGEQVELMTWSDTQASSPRGNTQSLSARSEAAAGATQHDRARSVNVQMLPSRIRTLDDDRRELVLGTADSTVWIVVRARVSYDELRALARRLSVR